MNYILLGAGILTIGGLVFIGKKMKISKEDYNNLKKKLSNKFQKKEKISEELKAFREGKIIFPLDDKDYNDKKGIRKSLNSVTNDNKREELINLFDNTEKDFKEFEPESRFNFEKEKTHKDLSDEITSYKVTNLEK